MRMCVNAKSIFVWKLLDHKPQRFINIFYLSLHFNWLFSFFFVYNFMGVCLLDNNIAFIFSLPVFYHEWSFFFFKYLMHKKWRFRLGLWSFKPRNVEWNRLEVWLDWITTIESSPYLSTYWHTHTHTQTFVYCKC